MVLAFDAINGKVVFLGLKRIAFVGCSFLPIDKNIDGVDGAINPVDGKRDLRGFKIMVGGKPGK